MNKKVIGCDIGGSHITAAIVDFDTEKIIEKSYTRLDVNSQADAESIVSQWADCIKEAAKGCSREELLIAIAVPGPFDYDNGISYIKGQSKYDALYKINVKSELSRHLAIPHESIRFVNDAASFLHGEVSFGVGKGYKKAIGLTLGTGLGSAVYAEGKSMDADLWQTPFKDSIAEHYLSARWLTNTYSQKGSGIVKNVREMAELTEKNGEVAKTIFEQFGVHLREFIDSELLKYDPEVIILGGNISKAIKLFLSLDGENVNNQTSTVNIVSAILGEHSALYGAAKMSFENTVVVRRASGY